MKLRESDSFRLFDKYGILHPKLSPSYGKVVVKADLTIGGKKKAGLVEICDFSSVHEVAGEMGVPVVVEEFIEHRDEFFVALKVAREGVEIYYSGMGGIDVENNWEKVEKVLVLTGSELSEDFLFNLVAEKAVREWIVQLYDFFQKEDATYLEINPFTIVNKQVIPLGVVLVVDDAAGFRHRDWPDFPEEKHSEREKHIAQIDSEIKGSVKLVEVLDGGDTAVMGGGGATMFLCDAIIENGFKLANYAEFSGNPPDFAVSELTKAVCGIPGIKNLVIGSGIANFTPVIGNFKGMIEGFKASPMAKKLNIVIRRCGPQEEEAILMMKQFAVQSGYNIRVFGRETPMTEIVKKL